MSTQYVKLRTYSQQGKAGTKAKKIKEQVKKIKEYTTNIQEHLRFHVRFCLVVADLVA